MEQTPLTVIMDNIRQRTAPGFLSFWKQYCPPRWGYDLNMFECTEEAIREWNALSNSEQGLFSNSSPMSDKSNCGDGETKLSSTKKTLPKTKKPRKPKVKKSTPTAARLNVTRSSAVKRSEMKSKLPNTYLKFIRSAINKNKKMEKGAIIANGFKVWAYMSEDEKKTFRCGERKPNQGGN